MYKYYITCIDVVYLHVVLYLLNQKPKQMENLTGNLVIKKTLDIDEIIEKLRTGITNYQKNQKN